MRHDPTSDAGLTTLDPNAGHITTVNVYTVPPERAEEVLNYLIQSAEETVRHVPGFLSFNFHLSLDRTQIVNYGQWESREAVMAARSNPQIVALMAETTKIAGPSNSIPYELRKSMKAAAATGAVPAATPSRALAKTVAADQPGPMPTHASAKVVHNLKLMEDGDGAFNRRDEAYFERAHHPDMVAHVMGSPEPIRGRTALAGALAGMLQAFPDMHVHNDYPLQFGDGDWTTVMGKVTGTFSGKMGKPDGTSIPGTGKSFDVYMTTIARWEDGQMVEEWVFWDSALLAQQIGLG